MVGGGLNKAIRLLVVDHQTLFCDLLTQVFRHRPSVEAVAGLGDVDEAVRFVATFRPHVVLMDIRRGCHQAFTAAQTITIRSPESRVLFIDETFCAPNVWKSWHAGGWGYWTKDGTLGQIEEAVCRVAAGTLAFCPAAQAELAPTKRAKRSSASHTSALAKLSMREIEVLRYAAEGLTIAQCAERMKLSRHTVDYYKRRCMRKLGVHNKAQLVRVALRAGLIEG